MAIIPISSANDILAWLEVNPCGGIDLKMRHSFSEDDVSVLRIDRQGIWSFTCIDEDLGLPLDDESAIPFMGTI